MNTLILHSNRVVTPHGVHPAFVTISDGIIADVAETPASGATVEEFDNLVLMPGLVDTHVHINEPGRTEWEGFETATKAAAAGGITTLVDMPLNSSPVTTTTEAFKKKLAATEGKLWVDCGFYAGLVPGNAHELESLFQAGVLGVKAFLIHSGIDEFPNATEADLRAAMPIMAEYGVPLLVHCELMTRSNTPRLRSDELHRNFGGQASIHHSNPKLYHEYLSSRPPQWEHDAIELMIRLCREFNTRTHIVHLSSADAVPMIEKARSEKLPLTVETCPHYLYFCAEEIPDGDTRYKCAPPIRERDNRERLWDALKKGVIDFIVTDHSPCPPSMKLLDEGDFMKAWGGIASLQLSLSIVWTEARKRGFSVSDIARWMCRKPAEFVGLGSRKGAIAPDFDADIVVWNPDAEFTVEQSMIHHRHKLTPYEGRALAGTVVRTYVRGNVVFNEGTFSEAPKGKHIVGFGVCEFSVFGSGFRFPVPLFHQSIIPPLH